MKIIECEQGSDEWHKLRHRPTASSFDRVLTPTGKRSSQADEYIGQIIAMRLGVSPENFESSDTIRGHVLEPEAVAFYAFDTGFDVTRVGFCEEDGGRWGCSPDGLVYEGDMLIKGVEIKCPKVGNYVDYRISQKCPPKYIPQVQGSMLVTDAEVWDFMPYHPDLAGHPDIKLPAVIPVERDEKYCSLLHEALLEFCDKLEKRYKEITQ